jgi:hypothetical protein
MVTGGERESERQVAYENNDDIEDSVEEKEHVNELKQFTIEIVALHVQHTYMHAH